MRPVLKPGLRRLWRDSSTLQLGLDPAHAVILTDLTEPLVAALGSLDGAGPDNRPAAGGDPAARRLVGLLSRAGLIDDADARRPLPAPAIERERLLPDLAALALAAPDPARARLTLARRHGARVRVRGAGRVGGQIATLLAAAGVGRVVLDDPGVATAADVSPGGLRLDDVGRPRALAALAAQGRVSGLPAARRGAGDLPFRPDLTVLSPVGPPIVHPDEALALEASGVPHLLAGVRERTGIVGPLVVPAVTGCLHCQHLYRGEADPGWPVLALQLVRPPAHGPDACETTLAALVAALAAMQALAFLDALLDPAAAPVPAVAFTEAAPSGAHRSTAGAQRAGGLSAVPAEQGGTLPAVADGTLEFTPPDWRIRRRSWPVHPNCPCRTARAAAFAATEPDRRRTHRSGQGPRRPGARRGEHGDGRAPGPAGWLVRPRQAAGEGRMERCPTSLGGRLSAPPS